MSSKTTPRSRWQDYFAGLSGAALSVPQVMGYARIAGVAPVIGLYTLLLPPLAFAAFGSSRHLVVAADSATAAILAGGLGAIAEPGSVHYMALVPVVAFLTAVLLLVARLFRLGFLADFLSRTVLVGFLAGVGMQIALSMLHDMIGMSGHNANPVVQLWRDLFHLRTLNVPTLILSAAIVTSIALGSRFAPKCPVPLIALVGSIALSAAFGFSSLGIVTLQPVTSGLPHLMLSLPAFEDLQHVLPIAGSCVFVIIAQSAATSRAFADLFNEQVDGNADILGLSAANLASSLTGSFVVNGSPSQTAVLTRFGARSQKSQIAITVVVAVILLCATAPLRYLPQCVLASIVFVTGLNMINVRGLLGIKSESPGEFRLALVTAATVVGVGVEQGILLATILSLLRHVRHSYEPHTSVLLPVKSGLFEAVPCRNGIETEPGLIIYRFAADLFYANCTWFLDDVTRLVAAAPHPVKCVVVDAGAVTDVDYSAAVMLRNLLEKLHQRHVTLFLGRVSPDLHRDMVRHHLLDAIGEGHVFPQLHLAVDAARAMINPTTTPS